MSSGNMEHHDLNLDAMINSLLGGGQPGAKYINLEENDLLCLAIRTRAVLLTQPPLLEIDAPVKVCGDIHGQFLDLLRLLKAGGLPPKSNYLFMGDYVDRGRQSLEVVCLLFAYKLKYPNNFFVLRGNHECASINRMYGFYEECKQRHSVRLWKTFIECFDCLPIAAVVGNKIFCCHGGISPTLINMEMVREIKRPTDVPDKGVMCDLLWSDPDKNIDKWDENDRGVSFVFGKSALASFLKLHNLDLVCRAHQVVEDGYEFFGSRQLVTVFSAPNYCGEFENAGGMMSVDPNLQISFNVLKPTNDDMKLANTANNNTS